MKKLETATPQNPNQLVYLAYGKNNNIITEARFSILSAIHRTQKPNFDIVVITDSAEEFNDLPIRIIPLSKDTTDEWAGKDHYYHRCKPNALLSVIKDADKSILIDSDTVLLDCPSKLFELITNKSILVDRVLHAYGNKKDAYTIRCGNFLTSKYGTDNKCHYVNSGLIGLTPENHQILQTTIQIIDEIYIMSGQLFHVEQVALAIAADFHGIQPVAHNKKVQHYYSSKKHIYRAQAYIFLQSHQDLLSEETRQSLLKTRLRLPTPALTYNGKIKLLSFLIQKNRILRRFYIEAMRARYPYKCDPYLTEAMTLGTVRNLKNRDLVLFNTIKQHGIKQLIPNSIMPESVSAPIERAIQSID